MPNLQRSPPDQTTLSVDINVPSSSDRYSSDSALNVLNQPETERYFNVTKRHKRSIEDLQTDTDGEGGSQSDPTLMIIKSLFSDFKEQQDRKFNELNLTLNTIMSQNLEIHSTVEKLNKRQEELLSKVSKLELENSANKSRISVLELKLEQQERTACNTSLELRNLPKQDTENKSTLVNIVQNLGAVLGLETPIQAAEIKNIYRTKQDAIVADFTTILRKEDFVTKFKHYNKRQKDNKQPRLNSGNINPSETGTPQPIYVSESLTTKTRRVFFLAREHVKNRRLCATWTSFGRVFVKREEDAAPIRVENEEDLLSLTM